MRSGAAVATLQSATVRRWALWRSLPVLRTVAATLAMALVVLSALLGGASAQAQDVQAIPALSGRVIDQTATLSEAQRQALERKLAAFEQEAGPQMVVLMVPTTAPEDIAAYAQRVGDQWKIGRRDVGDGLLIVVAKQDRRINIQTAKALEGAVPDLAARQIIEKDITPAFRAGDYAGGLNRAVDSLQARIRGEHLPAPQARERRSAPGSGGFDFGGAAALFFIGVPVAGALLTAMFGTQARQPGHRGWRRRAGLALQRQRADGRGRGHRLARARRPAGHRRGAAALQRRRQSVSQQCPRRGPQRRLHPAHHLGRWRGRWWRGRWWRQQLGRRRWRRLFLRRWW